MPYVINITNITEEGIMRTTVYIPDGLADEIREAAWKERKSVSI